MQTTAKKLVNRKHIFSLVFLCSAIYFVSYITRINYSAVLVEIMKSEGFAKTEASVPLTGLFIVYGAGQLISGILGDKFSPEKIIFSGLLLTCAMNILLPFCPSTYLMTAVWSVNGFAQALMWPPLVKIMAKYLTKENYEKNIAFVIFASSLGTIFVYAVSPVVISISEWKYVFFGAAAVAFVVAVVWLACIFRIENKAEDTEIFVPDVKSTQKAGGAVSFTKAALALLFIIMAANIFQGLLRDGITTWMPTYMADTFGFDSSSAILTGVALPLSSAAVSFFTAAIYRKILKNEAKCTTLFFSVCTLCCLVLCISRGSSPVISTVMLMAASAATHAVNFMYTSISVAKFERFNRTSFVTGAINSSVYIGSAASTYGIAAITTHFGWNGTMLAWLICSVVGLALSASAIGHFKREL